jgi:uncharacterized membrane protein
MRRNAILRARPAGPPAGDIRAVGGVGRRTSPTAERVSDDLRRVGGDFLDHRRAIAALSSAASVGFLVVQLYQFGLLRHLPEPRLAIFAADRVDAAGEAYQVGKTPDAALGLLSAAATAVLAGMGGRDRSARRPWAALALAGKTAADAAMALVLLAEQLTKHRRLCSWCTLAAVAQIATFPVALPEARAAWRRIRRTG